MQTSKKVHFYMVWTLAFPFVLLCLVLSAAISGQWKLIGVKIQLIRLSLYSYLNCLTTIKI